MNEFERVRRNILINSEQYIESYMIAGGIKSDISHLSLSHFSSSSDNRSYLSLPGIGSIMKRNITEIYFGSDFKTVENAPDYFLYNFSGITILDLRNLTGLKSIGSDFALLNYPLYMGAVIPPILGANFLYQGYELKVPSASVAAYKAADGWSNYSNWITGY